MNELATQNNTEMSVQKTVATLKCSLYPGATDASVRMVLDYCKARKLDPFLKPVHIVPMWDSKAKEMRDVIMPGLNLYRTQAAESGKLAGISEPEFGPRVSFTLGSATIQAPEFCKVTVKRLMPSGQIADFTAIEFFDEAVSVDKNGNPTPMWKKRPRGMLAKTAESQALRKAFPDIGAAETAEEMEGKTIYADDDQPPVQQQTVDQELAQRAFAAANEGSAAYKEFWKGLTQTERQNVRLAYPNGLAEVAKAADEANVEDVEVVDA